MNILKEIGKAFFIGILIFIIIGLIQYVNGWRITSGLQIVKMFVVNQIYSVSLYMINAVYFNYLLTSHKEKLFNKSHWIKGFVGAVLLTVAGIFMLRFIEHVFIDGIAVETFLKGESIGFYYVSFIISVVVTAIFYAFYYYRNTQERKVKEQKIIAGTASAQFDALKNQLDPHFLFNSLNVLTSLIEENPEAATRFTTSLSKVYRYVLEQKNKELVTLEEELKFAQLYISLLKMRFEDSIVFNFPETLSNPEAKIVPLSLQLLLENAVKHNQVTPQKKLQITITEAGNQLVVKNNLQPKTVLKESSGVGLKNIYQRYKLLSNRLVKVEQDANSFWVTLPLLTQKVITMDTQTQYISAKRYERAKKHVEELKGFYIHFTIYLIMIPVFIFLNLKSTSFPWALFPIGGWGLGIVGHASEVFNFNPFLGKNWEEKKIKELMNKNEK